VTAADRAEMARLRSRVVTLERELAEARRLATVAVLEQEDASSTTVVARIAALGIEHTPRLAWQAGAAAQAEWRRLHHEQPPKANTAKVSGTGAHCHARYPVEWADTLDRIIRGCAHGDARQCVLPLAEVLA
tara:strand:- start:109 stop:504 length:396 start_codon:yes stop_codon:yes gene_type:complete